MYDELKLSLNRISLGFTTDKIDEKNGRWITVHPNGSEKGRRVHVDGDGKVDSDGPLSDSLSGGDLSHGSENAEREGDFRANVSSVVSALHGRGLANGVSTDADEFKRLLEEHRKRTGRTVDALGFYNTADGKIYLDESRLTTKTALHEFAHPFLDKLRHSKSEEERRFWARGIELIRQAGFEVPNDEAYAGLSDEDKASEVLADKLAEHGKGVIEDTTDGDVDEAMRSYGRDFYRRMGREFGVGNIDPDDLAKMNLDEWIEAANAHLFGLEQAERFGVDLTESQEYLGNTAHGQLKFNTRTWEEKTVAKDGTVYESGRDVLEKALFGRVKKGDLAKEEGKAILDETERMYRICKDLVGTGKFKAFSKWCNAEVLLDEEGRPYYGVRVPNGDYTMNFDFSTVCKKRRPLDAIFAALIDGGVIKADKHGFINLNPETIARMQKVIAKHGFEVACALCFVDSKRYTIASDTFKFVAGWNGLVDKYRNDKKWWNDRLKAIEKKVASGKKKNFIERNITLIDLADKKLNKPKEFAKILAAAKAKRPGERKEPDMHALLVDKNPNIIHPIDAGHLLDGKHLSEFARENAPIYDLVKKNGGAHKAKDSFLDNPWFSDILRPFDHMLNPTDGHVPINREDAYSVGGVRLQSFSDFVPSMVFDYMQMMSELAANRLPMHVYTKEPSFVKIFGKTGAKINMSLVPAGDGLKRDRNGKILRDKSGRPVYDISTETFPESEAYKLRIGNPNVGTIMVGASDDHIREALRDDRIDMVIPYHKSGINPEVAMIRGISEHVDYSDAQHTKNASGNGFKTEPYDFYESLGKLKDPRKVAADYLAFCKRKGFTPKFEKFANEKNYYKLLADFRLYKDDGKTYAPQGDVRIDKDTYKGTLPHIKNALSRHEKDQESLKKAIGTKSKPGALYKDLVKAFFTGDEAKKREKKERDIASEKWTVSGLLDNSGSGADSASGEPRRSGYVSISDAIDRFVRRI